MLFLFYCFSMLLSSRNFFGFLSPCNACHFNCSSTLTCTYLVVYISVRVQTCFHPDALAYHPSLPLPHLHLHLHTAPRRTPLKPYLLLRVHPPALPSPSLSPPSSLSFSRSARPFCRKLLMINPHVLQSPPCPSLTD